MRQQQRYTTKLQKISQTSSPSKQQQSPLETASIKTRINPASLKSSYLKFKRFEQEKQKKSFYQNQSNKPQHQNNPSHQNQQSQSTCKTQTIEQKNHQISSLQESIVRTKMELTLLEDCFEKRSNPSRKLKFDDIFVSLLDYLLKILKKKKQDRKTYLSIILTYGSKRKTNSQSAFQGLVEWALKLLRHIFSLLSNLLKIPTLNNQ